MKVLFLALFVCVGLTSFGQHNSGENPTTESIQDKTIELIAPNAFTPDGDFFNDTWKVYMDGIDIYNYHLTIYDRAGQMIWESYDVEGEWDGNYGGHLAPSGLYVYTVEVKAEFTDEKTAYQGFISVLR